MRFGRLVFALCFSLAGFAWLGIKPAAAANGQRAPIDIDLSAGSLGQSNCKTAIGCAHVEVVVGTTSFVSEGTAASPAQHILTLQFKGPFDSSRSGKGPYALELDYELANPSGNKNNLLCAGAIVNDQLVQRCANAYSKVGRLVVPLQAPPEKIALQFGLIPWSAGHRFAVRNVQLVPGKSDERRNKSKGDSVDFTAGRLTQSGCVTPIGCAHPGVVVTPDTFSSIVPAQPGQNPPPPSDNPNQPPGDKLPLPQGRKLSLEVPVLARGKSLKSLHFTYAIESTDGQGGGEIAITAKGRTIVESVIDGPGSGLASIDFPDSSLPIESIAFKFIPRGAGRFAVINAGLGTHAPPDATLLPPIEETTACESCDPPASRLDPCGPLLHTFWVTAADSREGRGIRCVSNDLRAWYGEGWWVDPAYGRYRHLGYIPDASFGFRPGLALALDFGVTPAPAEGDGGFSAAYGTERRQILQIERTTPDRWHVFTATRSWDEIWQLVPKTELLPGFFGKLPWNQRCGSFGLYAFEVIAFDIGFRQRCVMPANLEADPNDRDHTSLPIVWYGESYLNDPDADVERTHLGWQTPRPVSPSPVAFYAASDLCVPEPHAIPCDSFDEVTIEVLEAGASNYPDGVVRDRQGLYVTGPGIWNHDGDGHGWNRLPGLPDDASLPTPSPVCMGEHCP